MAEIISGKQLPIPNDDFMNWIIIEEASEHNLKSLSTKIPRNRFVVFTGLSGSGKSSLAIDTLFKEGQRRFVESLSSYARQFLGQMEKPKVKSITGLSPAVSIEQKTGSSNPRSTVGTTVELNDYFRILFASIGQPHCPNCGKLIKGMTSQEIVEVIMETANYFRAPWGNRLKVITLLSSIFMLGLPVYLYFNRLIGNEQGDRMLILLPALLLLSALFMVRGYALTPGMLFVQRLVWQTKIDLSSLQSILVDPDAISGSVRTLGNG